MSPLRRIPDSLRRLGQSLRRLVPGWRRQRTGHGHGRHDEAGEPAGPPPPGIRYDYSFRTGDEMRRYLVYVPSKALTSTRPVPMLVMLHGCNQDAEDFARGTRMNDHADRHGFIVAWPEQTAQANEHRCWNWFQTGNQRRDQGEPAIIAGIVAEIIGNHRVDSSRIFVAGISAGASLAVTLARVYPDLFAGLAAHSGVPYRAAHETVSALGVMKRGPSSMWGTLAQARRALGLHRSGAPNWLPVPTIVLHGNRDKVVYVANGRAIADEAAALYGDTLEPPQATEWPARPGRYAVTRVQCPRGSGPPAVEFWLYDGLGHAWAGGDPAGSYTDPQGPDASEAIVGFLLRQPRERSRARAWTVRTRRSKAAVAT